MTTALLIAVLVTSTLALASDYRTRRAISLAPDRAEKAAGEAQEAARVAAHHAGVAGRMAGIAAFDSKGSKR